MAKKKEKITEFNRLAKSGLTKIIQEKKAALVDLRFDLAAGKVKNIREVRETRRDIARLQTILKSKS